MNKFIIALALCCVLAAVQAVPPVFTRPVVPVVYRTEVLQPSGPFKLSYETGDGIVVNEEGYFVKNSEGEDVLAKSGNYAYTSPDGTPISLSYVADEYGFRASGAHIPKAK